MKALIVGGSVILSLLIVALPSMGSTIDLNWQPLKFKTLQSVQSRASQGALYRLAESQLDLILESNLERFEVGLPLPNGQVARFQLNINQTMAPALAKKYPSIKTFSGVQIGNAINTGTFDITPHGFHGMFMFDGEWVFIDPKRVGQREQYISYFRKHAIADTSTEGFKQLSPKVHNIRASEIVQSMTKVKRNRLAQQVKTYRLAISAAAEYTDFFGGTKEAGLAAIVTTVNRLNQVYMQDLSLKFELVANNDVIIFTDVNTDPFDNSDADGEKNTEVINNAIGVDNYDLGHVVNTAGGGVAAFGVACDATYKGDGVTGDSNPVGDAFNIDYVAHEIGHQLRADHIFNGSIGACEGNRGEDSAYEPGSGSTIMGYAGICGEQNLQNNSDPFFHIHSIDQMFAFIHNDINGGGVCGSVEIVSNNVPEVSAGQDYTIPAHTPFKLVGQGSDSDENATLTYNWEQYDLGPATVDKAADETDSGQGPLFRSWAPTQSPERYFPKFTDVLANSVSYGETYPTTDRVLNFRLTLRDGLGGVADDAMQVTVVNTGEAFAVTMPTGGETFNQNPQTIQWNVAQTNVAPISCDNVDIKLSTNNGQSFDVILAENVVNDGEQSIEFPDGSFSQNKLMITCRDNIFYAVNNGTFASNVNGDVSNSIIGQQSIIIEEDTSITLDLSHFTVSGDAQSLTVVAGNNFSVENNSITPNANFNGELTVDVIAVFSGTASEAFPAKISVTAVNDLPSLQDDSLTVNQGSQNHSINVLANDSDIDGDVLTLVNASSNAEGTVTVESNTLVYSPAPNFSGTETVVYIVSDGHVNAEANLVITVNAASTTDNGNTTSGSSGGSFSMNFMLFFLLCFYLSTLHSRRLKTPLNPVNA